MFANNYNMGITNSRVEEFETKLLHLVEKRSVDREVIELLKSKIVKHEENEVELRRMLDSSTRKFDVMKTKFESADKLLSEDTMLAC